MPDNTKKPKKTTLTLTLDDAIVERLDRLAEHLQETHRYILPLGRPQAAVAAIVAGLAAYEATPKKKGRRS